MTSTTRQRTTSRRDRTNPRPPAQPHPAPDTQPADETRAEQAALGAMLLAPTTAINAVTTHIGPADYHQPRHATIHTAITTLWAEGTIPDPLTVLRHLQTAGELRPGHIDGPYLHTLYAAVPTAANAGHYALQVAEASRRRRLREAGAQLTYAATLDDPAQRDVTVSRVREQLDQATPTTHTVVDTWQPVDLETALTGGTITPPPRLMERTDGVCMIYSGRLHSLSGEPEAGKTWVALIAVQQALAAGLHVIYLDFEDTPEGIVSRLLALGSHPDHIRTGLHYIRPDRPTDDPARRQLTDLIAEHPVVLVVIDGITEAMTLHGLDPYSNPDAATFYEALPRHITRQPYDPPSVLMIDHVPKDEDRPKRYAIGAQHKLAGLDGAAYVVDIVTPFAPGQPGVSRIRVAKDRPGQVRRNAVSGVIAELHIDGGEPVVSAKLTAPLSSPAPTNDGGHWRPTMLMEKVSRWLEVNPGATQNEICRSVRGKAVNVRAAVDALVAEGYIECKPGVRGAQHHHVVEPFREYPDPPEPEDETP